MPKFILLILVLISLKADEYDFDMSAIEPEPYEYGGYIRFDDKYQKLNQDNEELQNYLHLEALLDFSYHYENISFKTSIMANYNYVKDKVSESNLPINELYINMKLNNYNSFLIGKESLKWGKGYYFNPIAFFDRAKDPSQPTLSREGYTLAKYTYNKSFSGELKNLSFDFVFLPSNENVNSDYNEQVIDKENSNNIAMRLYLLLYDTDIDFIYNYSDISIDKFGIDFSKNIQVNFEIHGEYAKTTNNDYSYLLGLRYLTDCELTIISEYLYNSEGLNNEEIKSSTKILPFISKDYFVTSITQKEPNDILYLSLYYKNTTNNQDKSTQHKVGSTYSFTNNVDIDFSYNKNSGYDLSEFGKRLISDFVWLQMRWNY